MKKKISISLLALSWLAMSGSMESPVLAGRKSDGVKCGCLNTDLDKCKMKNCPNYGRKVDAKDPETAESKKGCCGKCTDCPFLKQVK